MVRQITPQIRDDLESHTSPNALLAFITINHRNLAQPIRVVSDPIDFVVGGERYIGCPFEFKLLTDEDEAPRSQIRIQNVDRMIGEAIRSVKERAQVRLEIRTTADFNLSVVPRTEIPGGSSVIYGFRYFELIDVTVTSLDVTGTVMLRDYTQEPWPGRRATQSRTPGLFR